MVIPDFDEEVEVISTLEDKPPMSSDELKKKFDWGSKKIKEYLTTYVIPALREGKTEIVNNLISGGTNKALSAEMGKQLDLNKQNTINYGKTVPTLEVGEIFIQIFD